MTDSGGDRAASSRMRYVIEGGQHLGWSEDEPAPEEAVEALASMSADPEEMARLMREWRAQG